VTVNDVFVCKHLILSSKLCDIVKCCWLKQLSKKRYSISFLYPM